MGQLRIQHCIANSVTRQYGPHPSSDLPGVDFIRTVPANTEFPKDLPQLELFVRCFAHRIRRCCLFFTITLLDPNGKDQQIVHRSDTLLTNLGMTVEECIDRGFKLRGIYLPREGLYCIRVWRRVRTDWSSGSQVLAKEFFQIVRAS
jgi:hypothetical protein